MMKRLGEKAGIVILNYMNYTETFNCVDSALQQEDISFEIVIVDNGSTNESSQELKKKYRSNKLVHLLRTGKNYGFAKGNNIGIKYAKERLKADFILVTNSDTEFLQKDYLKRLIANYRNGIGVISSRIVQKSGLVQEKYYAYVYFPETLFFYLWILSEHCGSQKLSERIYRVLKKYDRVEIPHGSCFMLTPSFFRHYSGLYSRTFLYSEEVLLYLYCMDAKLSQVKAEEAVILHKGKRSSKYLYENSASEKDKYLLSSYKYVVWESLKAYLKFKLKGSKLQSLN